MKKKIKSFKIFLENLSDNDLKPGMYVELIHGDMEQGKQYQVQKVENGFAFIKDNDGEQKRFHVEDLKVVQKKISENLDELDSDIEDDELEDDIKVISNEKPKAEQNNELGIDFEYSKHYYSKVEPAILTRAEEIWKKDLNHYYRYPTIQAPFFVQNGKKIMPKKYIDWAGDKSIVESVWISKKSKRLYESLKNSIK